MMPRLLAQLSPEDVGVLKLALGLMGSLFLGLVTWVAVYMRRGRELVDEHVTEIALLKKSVADLELDVRDLRRRNRKPEDSHL